MTRLAARARVGLVAILAAFALVAASCGQLPDVHVDRLAAPGTEAAGNDGGLAAGDLDLPAPAGAREATREPAQTGSGTTTGSQRGGTGPATRVAGTSAQRWEVRGSDRTGVSADTIVLASHAPVTGAAPLPSRSFEDAADLYWRWVTQVKGEKVVGRSNIELVFADDRYQPSTAIQVCRQLAERAFALAGAGGTDQIQACARFANGARVPYASAGVTERGLQDLDWYFAFSMSYRAQGELLAQFVRSRFPDKKIAAVVTDTPNFDDAVAGWETGVEREGLSYVRTFRHPKGDTSWYNTIARELQSSGVEVLYINTSPVDYIRFAQQAAQQGFRPQYVGVGITMGLNPLLDAGCPQVDGGIFFSPFPGLDWSRQHVPEFFEAAQRFGVATEDLALAIWGQSRQTHELFKRYEAAYGTDLTREDYRYFLERQQNVSGGVFPDITYTPDNHFGARQVHVLQADCAKAEHVTLAAFASGF